MTDKTRIVSEETPRTHFTMIPNLVDEINLTPFAHRLYAHLRRVAGENGACWQNTKTLAGSCNMAAGSVSKAKRELVAAALIRIEKKTGPNGCYDHITILNIWQLNHDRFTNSQDEQPALPRSPGEQPNSQDELPRSPGESNNIPPERTIEENKERDTALSRAPTPPPCLPTQFSLSVKAILAEKHTASEWRAILTAERGRAKPRKTLVKRIETKLTGGGHPAIRIFYEIMGRNPNATQIKTVIATVGDNGRLEEWRAVVQAWMMLDWKKTNLQGMLEFFVEKRIPGQDRGRGKRGGGKRAPQIPDAAYWKRVQQEQA